VHDARTKAAAAAAITQASRDLRLWRPAARIPIPFPRPVQHDTTWPLACTPARPARCLAAPRWIWDI
jgi:hypothetical protein